jgi:hypothetical protein
LQACLHKVEEKQKNYAQHGSCFLFAEREQGDRDPDQRPGDHPPQIHKFHDPK